jgi:NodT family efflux transporter outer membrane factor (OMF) lipoprotein
MTLSRRLTFAVLLLGSVSLGACLSGPDYKRPAVTTPTTFKELQGWKQSQPSDTLDRGPWWGLLNDPVLDGLEKRVEVSNQNLAAFEAAYRQSLAIVAQTRATLFPTVSLSAGATQVGGGSHTVTSGSTTTSSSGTSLQLGLQAAWAPDLWGRIRREVEAAKANAQASAADLASAKLSAQATLAIDYVQLRAVDEDKRLLDETIKGYQKALVITQNRYNAGIAAKSDVLSAQTQLTTAQASSVDDVQTRAQLEHAIAVLVGEAPANFAVAPTDWSLAPPDVPVAVPSVLLERRPDVAAAERRAASANAQIGVQAAAFFPDINLNAGYGFGASSIGNLLKASNAAWTLGGTAVETLFDAGARSAAVRAARAAYDEAVANYRQAVLTAFQNVEDELAAVRVLEQDYALRMQASHAADQNEQILLNQYASGQVAYTDVVVAQANALAARRTALGSSRDRIVAAVSLIQALGGGWSGDVNPPALARRP